jgi:hypothetical protein
MTTEPNDSATGYGFANQYTMHSQKGLTKREYFAAIAMQGILAGKIQTDTTFVAEYAIDCADELIELLNLSNQEL